MFADNGVAQSEAHKSIKDWTACNGTTDDAEGIAKAFAAAAHSAFTLVVDCPLRMHVGMDIMRPIFIDDGTTVEFTGSGKLDVDNIFIPAFVIADSGNISLTNWNVQYDGSLPIDPKSGGYTRNGAFVAGEHAGGAFNSLRITPWLTANRGVVFDGSQGRVTARWSGPTDICAMFLFTGAASNVRITGMRVYAPPQAGAERFVPVVFALDPNFTSKQTVTAKSAFSTPTFAIPHDLTFSNISLDGTYMGWVGMLQNSTFENIQSARYGDLQDSSGANIGGLNKWFAPPHLFYLQSHFAEGDPALSSKNIQIKNVVDRGQRLGKARDLGGEDKGSGNALSLKIGCVDCSVENYKTARPDGFLDVLSADGLTISNVEASYDSAFLNNMYPGWRFPKSPYSNLRFQHITLIDLAPVTTRAPIDNATAQTNRGLQFSDIHVIVNRWSGAPLNLPPMIVGEGNSVALNYWIKADSARIQRVQNGALQSTLQVTPTAVSWWSQGAEACSASGAWSGSVPPSGTRSVAGTSGGAGAYSLACSNANGKVEAAVSPSGSP